MRPTRRPIARLAPLIAGLAAAAVLGTGRPAASQATTPAPPAKAATKVAPPAAKQAKLDAGPTVLSSEAMEANRRKNARDDRYGGPNDLRDVPAWRQASFYGLRAEGKVFIFVVDRSGSMEDGDRLDRAKRELIRSVGAMQPPQRFQVIFYNDRATPMPGELPRTASHPSRVELARFLDRIDAAGGTDPRDALTQALAMRPDGVFLLSDGAFPDGTAAAVAALNRHKTPIHCVDLAGGAGGDDLRTIARESGGRYAASGR